MVATQPIRNKQQIRQLIEYFLDHGQYRNYLLVVMGFYTALRISDLLGMHWRDVYNFQTNEFHSHVALREKKTGKSKTIALNNEVLEALHVYFNEIGEPQPGDVLFRSNRRENVAITRIQAYRIIRHAADSLNIDQRVSCHSLRKSFGYHAWKSGAPVTVIMDIYNHNSLAVTKRYLGVCQDDRDQVYLHMDFSADGLSGQSEEE